MIGWYKARLGNDEVMIGNLGHGLPGIHLVKKPDGWHVRFGTETYPHAYATDKQARTVGMVLAKRVLSQALAALEDDGPSKPYFVAGRGPRPGARPPPRGRRA